MIFFADSVTKTINGLIRKCIEEEKYEYERSDNEENHITVEWQTINRRATTSHFIEESTGIIKNFYQEFFDDFIKPI